MTARDVGLLNDGHHIGAFSDQGEVITMNRGDLWITHTSSKAFGRTALQTVILGWRTLSDLADDSTPARSASWNDAARSPDSAVTTARSTSKQRGHRLDEVEPRRLKKAKTLPLQVAPQRPARQRISATTPPTGHQASIGTQPTPIPASVSARTWTYVRGHRRAKTVTSASDRPGLPNGATPRTPRHGSQSLSLPPRGLTDPTCRDMTNCTRRW